MDESKCKSSRTYISSPTSLLPNGQSPIYYRRYTDQPAPTDRFRFFEHLHKKERFDPMEMSTHIVESVRSAVMG